MILACQENHLPGKGLVAKWEFAQEAGFDERGDVRDQRCQVEPAIRYQPHE